MRQVMFGENAAAAMGRRISPSRACNSLCSIVRMKTFPYPDGHGGEKNCAGRRGARRDRSRSRRSNFRRACRKKDHAFKIRHAQAAFFQESRRPPGRKGRIVLLAGKAFLMGRGDNPARRQISGRAVGGNMPRRPEYMSVFP